MKGGHVFEPHLTGNTRIVNEKIKHNLSRVKNIKTSGSIRWFYLRGRKSIKFRKNNSRNRLIIGLDGLLRKLIESVRERLRIVAALTNLIYVGNSQF